MNRRFSSTVKNIGIAAILAMFCQSCAIAADTNSSVIGTGSDGVKIAIGDGKISSLPKIGHVYSCKSRFNPNAPGAQASGDWIQNGYWYPDLKPTVSGNVIWTGGGTTVSVSGNTRKISSKNLPNHTTGVYPVARDDDAYQFDRNPNRISAQNVALNLSANPSVASSATCVPMGVVGVALTGAVFFNALDARGDDAVAHEIQDSCSGHPEHDGRYHYHGPSDCMTEQTKTASGHSGLVGYALDGFGIFGFNDANGKTVTNADLDECHGHTEVVNWDGVEKSIYHYHLTAEYPYTVGCFRGKT